MAQTPSESWRGEFPVVDRFAYFNHAGIGPPPRRSTRAMCQVLELAGDTGDQTWDARHDHAEVVRRQVARFLGAAEHEVAFVANTSDGLSIVAAGLDWRAGDNVVGCEAEFPSNVYPWTLLARRGVEHRLVPEREGRLDPNELLDRCDSRTRVLALSWVQYASGFKSDLAALGAECRRRGILFVVDAIQGLGALPLDVERSAIDVCATATHKWLLGPEGLGLLYVSDRLIDRLEPARAGWRSVPSMLSFRRLDLTFRPGATRFECGTLNLAAVAGLGESLALLTEVGPERVEARVLALARQVAGGLAGLGFEVLGGVEGVRSGIVAATHPRIEAAALARQLEPRGVIVAERMGRLRVSPHFYNDEAEVATLLAALEELLPA